ncbi:MAG: NAD(P)/FAD-dependent oxidoreductase [Acidobacteria bacterium]|nr:MAG: NAD(P)/FAD-dependent oxidoreductase [Acidobacteriota bacterium]REK02198.1 MAG: NAD(P)/FAD-dependent oxidoreductase [Acidobacteriota bacterium]REK13999.1 MAG: NAD(P)/FAD-dependent oxidoreductase [Acidobacteriota bacterium]REK41994.1 MAG: NAD(P)/FAD-dependent oxidoreductase [Acidobacteriota bacterium]
MNNSDSRPKVVIIGGGFGGLEAAKRLKNRPVDVTIVDRKNHHTFQPLLYQVATAVLSPGQIASPIRRILRRADNIEVLLGEVVGFDLKNRKVKLKEDDDIAYDYLIIAAGARHAYFGHDEWEDDAPGLKTIEDALEIRRRVLLAFELAERDAIQKGSHDPLNFVVVGAGATGVELAGAIAGIARRALAKDFKAIDTKEAKVLLLEGADRVLGSYSRGLSEQAKKDLESLGVEVRLNSFVTEIAPGEVRVGDEWIDATVVLWATGVAASPLGSLLGAETDKAGRVVVNDDLTVSADRNIFVIGDMARVENEDGSLVPGVAPAAIQMAQNAAANILSDLNGGTRKAFNYKDKGSMATIGRNKAIVEAGRFKMTGFLAWIAWLMLHIILLIGFRNRIFVLSEWIWAYFTRERTARLITGDAEELSEALEFLTARPAHVLETEKESIKSA